MSLFVKIKNSENQASDGPVFGRDGGHPKQERPTQNALALWTCLVPEVGVEPTRTQGPEDFESSASTHFTTPAQLRRSIGKEPAIVNRIVWGGARRELSNPLKVMGQEEARQDPFSGPSAKVNPHFCPW